MDSSSTVSKRELKQEAEPPSLVTTLGIVLVSYLVFYIVLRLAGGSWSLVGGDAFADNSDYVAAAKAIRSWHFSGVVVKQFWGVSYPTAGLSLITGMSERASLVVVCVISSLISVTLVYRMWGGWVAIYFALLSFDWFQRSLLGGAEPLFMALILGAFVLLRRDRWPWSSLFAALATTVRPFGIFALIGLGLQLLWQRKIPECAWATAIGVAIGAAYSWVIAKSMGSAFGNVALYRQRDWHGGSPLNFPFLALIRDSMPANVPLTNTLLAAGWALLLIAGLAVAIFSGELKSYATKYPAEVCFVCLYSLALYSYDASGFERSSFVRFALPMLPWTLVFLRRYLPAKRWVVGALAVVTPTLAAASALGIRNVAGKLLGHH
jgi:hypothetical protein